MLLLSHLSCFPPLISSHHSENQFFQPSISTLVLSSLSLGIYSGSRRSSSQSLSCQGVRECVCLSRYFRTFQVGTHNGGHQAHFHVSEMRKPRLKEDKCLAQDAGTERRCRFPGCPHLQTPLLSECQACTGTCLSRSLLLPAASQPVSSTTFSEFTQ